jgi:hypothetical protein
MSSEQTILTAHNEWSRRPDEDRCASLAEWTQRATDDAASCVERIYAGSDLRVDVQPVGGVPAPVLVTPKGAAAFSHWGFGQTARLCKAPAAYLQSLPPSLAAQCLSHGLTEVRGDLGYLKLYARRPASEGTLPTLRAVSTDSYTRVTDATIGRAVDRLFIQPGSVNGHEWKLPTDWSGKPSGAYRSDRDSFLFMIDGGSIVDDPSARNGSGQMFRGLMIGNSEVGARSITVDAILFRYVCGNLMIWGATYDRRFARRHVGAVDRRFASELSTLAYQWTHASTGRDDALLRYMIDHEIAQTRDGVIDALVAAKMPKRDAEAAYARAEATEANPRSWWGAANGITRISQDEAYTGDRVEMDAIAAGILAKAARLARV